MEFKESVTNSLTKELVAFANAGGGKIFIGVKDNDDVKGVRTDNTIKSRIQDMANNCDPAVNLKISTHQNVLIIDVPEGQDKPYHCAKGFYLRIGPNTQKMSRNQIIDFLQFEGKLRYEELLNKKFDFNKHYAPEKLETYLRLAGIAKTLDDETILENLGVLEYVDGKPTLNNAGTLFFSNSIERLCEHSTITCVVFDGTIRKDIANRKDYGDDIITNIEDAMRFVKKEFRVRYILNGEARRKEVYEIPLDAIRETIVNAVYHRDYFEYGAHTVIEIFDDRLEVCNPGGLVKGLSLKDFGKKAIRRNQLIANLLHRADYGENLGTGISRIKDLLKANECPDIEFEITSFFTCIFRRYPYGVSKKVKGAEVQDEVRDEVRDEVQEQVPKIILNDTDKKILKFCGDTPKASNEIFSYFGYKSKTGNIRQSIIKLRKSGFIAYILPDKPSSKNQKYIITKKGKRYLK